MHRGVIRPEQASLRPFDRRRQLLQPDWFGDMIIHPGRQTVRPVRTHRIRCQCHQPRLVLQMILLPNPSRRLQSVHFRHLYIQEDKIERLTRHRLQDLLPIRRHFRRMAQPGQKTRHNLHIYNIVVRYQDPQ